MRADTTQLVILAATIFVVIAAHRHVRPAIAVTVGVAVSLAVGALDVATVVLAARQLREPIAFLIFAVPLAILLADIGFFDAAAERVSARHRLRLSLWFFAAGVTTLFNLDAAIVLLTPLYLRIAHRHGLDPVTTAFQPVLLASLASSALPVSNLTNLIFAHTLDLPASAFLAHLGLASLVAVVVGWLRFDRTVVGDRAPVVAVAAREDTSRSLRVGLPIVGLLLVGFTFGDRWGIPSWMVAAALVAALAFWTGRVPWRGIPWEAAVVATGFAALALGAAAHLPLTGIFGGTGLEASVRSGLAAVILANAVNNLPALLLALPHVEGTTAWTVLAGVNFGPVLWISGSLAGLLWMDLMRQEGHRVTPWDYARVG